MKLKRKVKLRGSLVAGKFPPGLILSHRLLLFFFNFPTEFAIVSFVFFFHSFFNFSSLFSFCVGCLGHLLPSSSL